MENMQMIEAERLARAFKLDRHVYLPQVCPGCGSSCPTHNWCGQCGKTVTP